jgi:hypothetical protein
VLCNFELLFSLFLFIANANMLMKGGKNFEYLPVLNSQGAGLGRGKRI